MQCACATGNILVCLFLFFVCLFFWPYCDISLRKMMIKLMTDMKFVVALGGKNSTYGCIENFLVINVTILVTLYSPINVQQCSKRKGWIGCTNFKICTKRWSLFKLCQSSFIPHAHCGACPYNIIDLPSWNLSLQICVSFEHTFTKLFLVSMIYTSLYSKAKFLTTFDQGRTLIFSLAEQATRQSYQPCK